MPDIDRRAFLKSVCCVSALLPIAWATHKKLTTPDTTLGTTPGTVPHEESPHTLTESRAIMGTVVTITLAQATRTHMEEALGRAFERMQGQIAIFDRFDTNSPLSELNTHGRLYGAPPALASLLETSQQYGQLTKGAFNVAVQPLVDLFRHKQNPTGSMHLSEAELREAQELAQINALSLSGRDALLTRKGMGLTLDGIAKGHIADETSQLLTELGLVHHLVNAGGDIVARGEKAPGKAWTVGVENPAAVDNPALRASAPYIQVLALRDSAIATSGGYRIYFDALRQHHHLINPAAGTSPQELSSVSVIARHAREADALATALAVMPATDGLRLMDTLPGCECLMVAKQGRQMASKGWLA